MSSVLDSPLITGAILALIATIPPFLVYRHARRVDAIAQEAGSFDQIMVGLKAINDLTRADNAELRARISGLDDRLAKAIAGLARCVAERRRLEAQVERLEIKYGLR